MSYTTLKCVTEFNQNLAAISVQIWPWPEFG